MAPAGEPAAEPAAPVSKRERPPIGFALSFGFEPRFGNYRALDAGLADYGFAPFDRSYLLAYGLRGRVYGRRGLIVGGTMNYSFARVDAAENPVPTVVTRLETLGRIGHQLGLGFEASANVGFGVHSMSVGSEVQGGALVYMGPVLQPQVGYTFPTGASFLHLSVGYTILLPVGRPHAQVLWERGFEIAAIHGFVVGVESGFTQNRQRIRWRDRR